MWGVRPTLPRLEIRAQRGEFLLVSWYEHTDGEFVRAITRAELDGDRVAALHNYFFTPDFIREVCGDLGLPCRVNGYRHCPPGDPTIRDLVKENP